MREDLVGHLLHALEPAESRQLEQALTDPESGPSLRRDLERLELAMKPLARDRDAIRPPAGLAGRTLRFIAAQQSAAGPLPTPVRGVEHRQDRPLAPGWSGGGSRVWIDRAIIAATALAACLLVAPLLLDSIAQARARRAERNLMRTATALQDYADAHGMFPTPPDSGPLSRAGLYAPTLVSEHRLAGDDGTLLYPDGELARSGTFRVPSLEELKAAVGTPRFEELVRNMGGDYGYTLGHRDSNGTLQRNLNRRRQHHPIMADAPNESGERSSNHPAGLHHILFEDGHVKRLLPNELHGDDHLYRNHDGRIAAGIDEEDAVIGDSHDRP